MGFQATLSNCFIFIFHSYIQAKNQNRIKYAKMFESSLSRHNVTHVGCRTYGISNMWKVFLSDCSIVRQMLEKWNVELMERRTTDMDPILIPAHEEKCSNQFVYEYPSIAVGIIKHICLCFHTCFFLSIEPSL